MSSRCWSGAWLACALVVPSLVLGGTSELPAAEAASKFTVGADGRSIEFTDFPSARMRGACRVNQRIYRARLTHDRKGVLVLPNGYVTVEVLRTCNDKQVPIRKNPQEGGEIEDINFRTGMYLGLLPTTLQPLSYLAVISRLGESKNLVRLPGAYLDGKLTGKALQQSFSYEGGSMTFARFSPDGRYVSPGGAPDCAADAYPGVWDLESQAKVVLQGNPDETRRQCRNLFEWPAVGER